MLNVAGQDTAVVYSQAGSRVTYRKGPGAQEYGISELLNIGNEFDKLIYGAVQGSGASRIAGSPADEPISVTVYSPSWLAGYFVNIIPSRENLILMNSLSAFDKNNLFDKIEKVMMDNFPTPTVVFYDGDEK